MGAEIRVSVDDPSAGDEERESLSLALREELLSTDVGDVHPVSTGPAPEGSRGVDAAAVGQLLVTVPASLAAVAELINAVRGWLGRAGDGRTVELTLGGNSLRLGRASTPEQERLVEAFLQSAHTDTLP